MAWKKNNWIFDPESKTPFRMSRTKIDLFVQCPKCFYLHQRLNVKRTSFPAFTLNSAVDQLLKSEFDIYRAQDEAHPLMESYGIDMVPFEHPKMDDWRHNFRGVKFLHEPTNLELFGAVDDIWVSPNKTLSIVDYKSTSTSREITLEGKWKEGYKRQMEIYQWLLRGQEDLLEAGYSVSDKGYFVYVNGRKDKKAFDAKLEFDVQIIPYVGDDSWVEKTVIRAHECMMGSEIPESGDECEYCDYRKKAREVE